MTNMFLNILGVVISVFVVGGIAWFFSFIFPGYKALPFKNDGPFAWIADFVRIMRK